MESTEIKKDPKIFNPKNVLKFVIISLIGIFIYFVQLEFNGRTTIFVDHVIQNLNTYAPMLPHWRLHLHRGADSSFIDKT
jgi:nucleoside recognition membrane protein YjiH